MNLEDQLRGGESGAASARLNERLVSEGEESTTASLLTEKRRPGGATDPYGELKMRVQRACIVTLGPWLFSNEGSDELEPKVRGLVATEVDRDPTPLAKVDRDRLVTEITADILGYGPIEPFLADPTVTEVMVNGYDQIYIERAGLIEPTEAAFVDEEHLVRIIDKIVSRIGRRVDEASPMVDARLPDGSRVNAILPPLSLSGPTLTIRKFARDRYTADDLMEFGTLTEKAVHFLDACVRGQLNVLISGGTGTGKTTLLNVVSAYIPEAERIVTIEDAAELQLHQRHVVRLESRPPNIEGMGQVRIRELVRNALRMRPDRIVVGEVRGAETLDMLQAMNTGHDGSLTTIHSNSPRDALNRLETLVMMAGLELPHRAIREQIASALDVIVHITRLVDGSRRVSHVTEVLGMESDVITLQDIFVARAQSERAAAMGYESYLRPLVCTGLQPHFQSKLAANGVVLPEDFYQPDFELIAGAGEGGAS